MNTARKWIAGTAVAVLVLMGVGAAGMAASDDADVVVASGKLDDEFLARALFHVGEFWIRVPADTEFNRWISQGIGHTVVVRLVTNAAPFADVKNVRILSGTLMHDTAPDPTPLTTNVVGRLPTGDLSIVHILHLKDEVTGTLGAVTFETADLVTASKFDPYDNAPVNIVIEIK